MAPSRSVLLFSAALVMSAGPCIEAHRRLRSSFVEKNDDGISVWTPFGPVNIATRGDGKRNSTVVTTPFANVTTRGNETHVTTPITNVDTNAHGTTVTSPLTNVTTNGTGTSVTGPYTDVASNSNDDTTRVDAPSVVRINGTSVTITPADCAAWAPDDACSAAFTRFDDVLSDDGASERDKDDAVRRFCFTPCGAKYTTRLQGHLQGVCVTPARPRGEREEEDANAQPAADEPRPAPVTSTKRPASTTDSDDKKRRVLRPRTVASTEYERAEILRSRVGEPLGCLADEKGRVCALLRGCDFWGTCCGASLANAWAVSGAPLSNTTTAAIDELCPGAKPFVTGGRSGC